jgi:glycosyltransferase involved in cell wall biosynthesis
MIGHRLSRELNIPWIADFRDPWTRIYYQESLMVGKRAGRIHRKLEQMVVRDADAVTVVTHEMKSYFEKLRESRVDLIPNGYDDEDFRDISTAEVETESGFSITHIGTLFPLRNPLTLWSALAELISKDEKFAAELKINLVGAIDLTVSESIGKAGLEKWVNRTGNIPFREAIRKMRSSQVLLLLIMNHPEGKGILTGKLFEYMNAGRPILAIGPEDGEVSRVLRETDTGKIVDFNDLNAMKDALIGYYRKYQEGKLYINPRNIEKYSRKSLTSEMVEVFNRVLNKKPHPK